VKSYVEVQPRDNHTVFKPIIFTNYLFMKLSVVVANRKYFNLTVEVDVAHCRSWPHVYAFTLKPVSDL